MAKDLATRVMMNEDFEVREMQQRQRDAERAQVWMARLGGGGSLPATMRTVHRIDQIFLEDHSRFGSRFGRGQDGPVRPRGDHAQPGSMPLFWPLEWRKQVNATPEPGDLVYPRLKHTRTRPYTWEEAQGLRRSRANDTNLAGRHFHLVDGRPKACGYELLCTQDERVTGRRIYNTDDESLYVFGMIQDEDDTRYIGIFERFGTRVHGYKLMNSDDGVFNG